MNRRRHYSLMLLCLSAGVFAFSCENGEEAAEPATPVGFQTPESLLEHVRMLPATSEGRMALMNLIAARSTTEEQVLKIFRDIDAAKLDYANAMNEKFGAGSEIEPTDLGMAALIEDLARATGPRTEGRFAFFDCTRADGSDASFVLVRTGGSWHVSPSTLRGGDEITDRWAAGEQGRFRATIRSHKTVATDIRDGRLTSAEAARAELKRLLNQPAPALPSLGR